MQIQETGKQIQQHTWNLIWATRCIAHSLIRRPEFEVKILLGTHLHQTAELAAAFAKRADELGMGVDIQRPPSNSIDYCKRLIKCGRTKELLCMEYPKFIRCITGPVRRHLAEALKLEDEPSCTLLRTFLETSSRWLRETKRVSEELNGLLDFQEDDSQEAFHDEITDLLPYLKKTIPKYPARDSRLCKLALPASPMPSKQGVKLLALHFLHHNITELEVPTMEACARLILEFPEMPWEFVRDMGRQCYDEVRHASAFRNRLLELGGELGQFSHSHGLWEMASDQPLEIRLALHQRIGEWIGVDGAIWYADCFRKLGDARTATIMDYVTADEITHVAFGNRWIRFIAKDQDSIDSIHKQAEEIRSKKGKGNTSNSLIFPPNGIECQKAGFTNQEAENIMRRFEKEGSIFPPHETNNITE